MLSATYLFSGNSHMYISYLKILFDFLCLPIRKFCYNGRNKTLNSMKTLKLKLLQVRLKWKKNSKILPLHGLFEISLSSPKSK